MPPNTNIESPQTPPADNVDKMVNIPLNPPQAEPEQPENLNLNNELDDLLSKAFPGNVTEEMKKNLESDKPEKPNEKQEPKKEVKTEKVKQEKLELPDPETIDEKAPGKSQQSKDGWNALRNNYKNAVTLVKEREEEIARLKSGLAEKADLGTKEAEALRNEIKELSKYRAMVDIQADPEFISKYDQPISKLTDSIKDLFRGIKDKQTGNPISPQIIDSINFTDTATVDAILDAIEGQGDKTAAKRIQRKVEELADLNDKRNETLAEQKTNYQEMMESKKKESSLKTAEEEGRLLKRLQEIPTLKDRDGNPLVPFLVKRTPTEGASKPQIEQIEHHNKLVDIMNQKIGIAIKASTPEEKADVAVAAASSHYLAAQLRSYAGKIKSLEEEIKKISTVSSDDNGTKPKVAPRSQNGQTSDLDSALSEHFAR